MGCCAEVMPRSKWKGPFVDASILRRLMQTHPEAGMKIYSRRSVIMSDFIGLKFQVHNGKSFIPIRVLPEMVGRKFGEFSKTRKQAYHNADNKDASGKPAAAADDEMIDASFLSGGAPDSGGRKKAFDTDDLLTKLRAPVSTAATVKASPTKSKARPKPL